jgi:hypothetical protein
VTEIIDATNFIRRNGNIRIFYQTNESTIKDIKKVPERGFHQPALAELAWKKQMTFGKD